MARFSKKIYLTKKCILIRSTTFVWTISHPKRIALDMMINVYWSSRKVDVFLVIFQWLLRFLGRISKNIKISNFINIFSVGTEMFHADGQTDMVKRTVVCRNFANAPKNVLNSCLKFPLLRPWCFSSVCVCVCVWIVLCDVFHNPSPIYVTWSRTC
jgi:hypothetical protein